MKVPPFSLEGQLAQIGSEIEDSVLKVIRGGNYIGGKEVDEFERSFADFLGVSNVVGCNSGTDALILALRALEIGEGDEVITPSFSFFATAEAISSVGANPVFVDIDPSTFLIDFQSIESSITSLTKAIIPVHLFGRPVDMDGLMQIAKKHDLKVIEDCAQAAGAKWNEKPVGSWGDIGCFSFFPTKNLGAAGDAGAVTSNNSKLSKRMRELALHGMPRRYFHTNLGYNSRLDAIQAAILNIKLPKLSEWIEQRNNIAKNYIDLLNQVTELELPELLKEENCLHSWNQFVVQIKDNSTVIESDYFKEKINLLESPRNNSRDYLKEELENHGVNTIIYYPIPIHLQPAYNNLGYKIGSIPITERICSQVLSLPIFPEISLDQQKYVADKIKLIFNNS